MSWVGGLDSPGGGDSSVRNVVFKKECQSIVCRDVDVCVDEQSKGNPSAQAFIRTYGQKSTRRAARQKRTILRRERALNRHSGHHEERRGVNGERGV